MKTVISFLFLLTVSIAQDMRITVDNYSAQFNKRLNSFGKGRLRDYFVSPTPLSFISDDVLKYYQSSSLSSLPENEHYAYLYHKFNYDLSNSFQAYDITIDHPASFINDRQHNFFFSDSAAGFSYFMNGIFESDYSSDLSNQLSASYIRAGMSLGGRIDNFSFYFFATNGKSFGEKKVYSGESRFKENYKFNESPDASFFDETHGFLSYSTNNLELKLGRDYVTLGHSSNFPVIDHSGLPLDFFSLRVQSDYFNYSHLHAKLLDRITVSYDSVSGNINSSEDKHLAYHRFSVTLFNSLILGMGEFVIYSARGLDLSYINPFSFYKSIEHSNRDRDNSLLFIDFLYNPGVGIQPYGLILLDDIDFSKMGTGWWGNQVLYNAGIWIHTYVGKYPLDINADWLRAEPYVFSHRIHRNNFTDNGTSLASSILPNSNNYSVSADLYISPRLKILMKYHYYSHGKNLYDANGNLVFNAGGDVNEGKRLVDSDMIRFGEGENEQVQNLKFELLWEFIRNFRTSFGLDYNHTKSKNLTKQEFFNYIRVMVKF